MIRRLLPIVIIVAGVLVFQLLKLTRPEPPSAAQTERVWPVEVRLASPTQHQPSLPVYGEVTAPDRLTLVAPVSGRVSQRPVSEGESVEAGQLLVAMDPADVEPLLAQARADVADLQAQIASEQIRLQSNRKAVARERAVRDSASKQLERTQTLVSRNLASQRELDTARDALQQAELALTLREQELASHPARLDSLQARLRRAQASLSMIARDAKRARAVAPFAGVVTGVSVAEGDRVTANSPLLSLYQPQRLEIQARIPSRYAAALEAELSRGATVEAVSDDGRVRLQLQRFAGESDARGPLALFRTAPGSAPLRPGAMVSLQVLRPPLDDVIAVPYSALYGGDSLYLMTDEERLRRVTVRRLGEVTRPSGQVEVLVRGDRLGRGDRIVVTHLPSAVEGLRVSVAEPPPATSQEGGQ